MGHSYDKKQRTIAKEEGKALFHIGYDGQYMGKPQGGMSLDGPISDSGLKKIQKLVLELCKECGRNGSF